MIEQYFYFEMNIEVSKWERQEDEEGESCKQLWETEVRYEYPFWADGGALLGWYNPFKPARKHRIKDRQKEARRVAESNLLRFAEIRVALEGLGLPGLRTPQSIQGCNVWREGKGWVTFAMPEEGG